MGRADAVLPGLAGGPVGRLAMGDGSSRGWVGKVSWVGAVRCGAASSVRIVRPQNESWMRAANRFSSCAVTVEGAVSEPGLAMLTGSAAVERRVGEAGQDAEIPVQPPVQANAPAGGVGRGEVGIRERREGVVVDIELRIAPDHLPRLPNQGCRA